MKNCLLLLLLSCFITAGAQNKKTAFYKPVPAQFTAVNDYAGMLSATEARSLSEKIAGFKDSTGNVIVIITHNNLKDSANKKTYAIEEAALRYFNTWKIGQKDKNNGVLILVAKEQRKIRIATGKGISNILTSADCGQIIHNDIVPAFKQQEYYSGLDAALQSVFGILQPSFYKTPVAVTYDAGSGEESSPVTIAVVIVTGLLLLFILSRVIYKENNYHAAYNSYDYDPYYRSRSWWYPYFLSNWLINDRHYSNTGNNNADNNYTSFGNDHSFNNDSSSSSSSDSSGGGNDSFGGGSSGGDGASGNW